ncbi:tRNA 2-thiouridine(34) synthase MnmA [Fervidobacterium thailandense]|uniref:tRNA-uridine 2-sulfurtransferase n=2 Tax=Fervidobacterium thailandense TaxID=1008305 RepID=A0A1E3G277_9BACT|nr:tRNA 2-thiouridine(34) synthase MnmA [Fervidobacterium thailandense]
MKTVPDKLYITKEIKHKVCCSPSDTYDAQLIAKKFNVPFKILHIEDLFEEKIINYFIEENLAGRTPNPCFFCNELIKFGVVMEIALADGMDYVASGHYARIIDGKLYRALDKEKDQSYFLASIKKEKLERIILPNGEYTKEEIRKIAAQVGIHVSQKMDSQDLCFLPDNDLRSFFEERGIKIEGGNIITEDGRIVGKHDGLPFYTIGQRKIGVATGQRLYVKAKNVEGNFIVVAPVESVNQKTMKVKLFNTYEELPERFEATVKIRKKFKEVACTVNVQREGTLNVEFAEPTFGVTPGQIAVFYDGDKVICSGIIEK